MNGRDFAYAVFRMWRYTYYRCHCLIKPKQRCILCDALFDDLNPMDEVLNGNDARGSH